MMMAMSTLMMMMAWLTKMTNFEILILMIMVTRVTMRTICDPDDHGDQSGHDGNADPDDHDDQGEDDLDDQGGHDDHDDQCDHDDHDDQGDHDDQCDHDDHDDQGDHDGTSNPEVHDDQGDHDDHDDQGEHDAQDVLRPSICSITPPPPTHTPPYLLHRALSLSLAHLGHSYSCTVRFS
jgi:hypothetical protein